MAKKEFRVGITLDALGEAAQDYLKTIYHLQAPTGQTSTMEVARAMGVSGASVTSMVKKLSSRRLLAHRRYHGIALTEAGTRAALEVIRHHRLLELFLSKNLGYPLADVHIEADRLEHVISERFEQMMDASLGSPGSILTDTSFQTWQATWRGE